MNDDLERLMRAAKAAGKVIVRAAEPGDAFDGLLVEGDEWAPSESWDLPGESTAEAPPG